jgi:hypothetical protein
MEEKKRENRDLLNEMGYEDLVIFENPDYDAAIVGVSEGRRVIYDFDKMVECLVKEDGMSEEDAVEFIEYNTIRALPYFVNSPIIMYPLK